MNEPIKLYSPTSQRDALHMIMRRVTEEQAGALVTASLRGELPSNDLFQLCEVVCCVPCERATALVAAWLRGEPISERVIDRPDLQRSRGWTKSMLKRFLPEPIAEDCNKLACWLLSDIEQIESTAEWQVASAKAARRRAA